MNCALNTTVRTTGRVVVLIPHYNDIAGLNLALASLTGDTVAVIVVDDGSTTPPQEQALREAHPYLNSLHIIYLAENIDIAQNLNVGLSYASDYDYDRATRLRRPVSSWTHCNTEGFSGQPHSMSPRRQLGRAH